MIQLNLLPDVKLELVKAQRLQRAMTVVSVLASLAAIALVVVLFSASQIQKKHINDLNADIAKKTAQLNSDKQINKILTVQNQLNSLTQLHASKPAASRLFGYLNQVTPADVSISSFTVDFSTHSMTITGGAGALSSVNKYVDTLKFTEYTVGNSKSKSKAFNGVVLTSFSVSSNTTSTGPAVSYTITTNYEPAIFDISKEVSLIVPQQTTTRSTTEQPTNLFVAQPAAKAGGN